MARPNDDGEEKESSSTFRPAGDSAFPLASIQFLLKFTEVTSPPDLKPSSFLERVQILGVLILGLWGIEILDRFLFDHSLQNHGIHPRSFSHLGGLVFAPFLHAGWSHLIGNSASLLVLGSLILASGWRDYLAVSIAAAITGGVVVWLIGKSGTNHIGASSVVFGYLAFLLASGYYRPSPTTILVSVLVLFFYGGSLLGILPTGDARASGVSWEGHLGGAIGGLLIARERRRKSSSRPGISGS